MLVLIILILIVVLWIVVDFYETELKMADKNSHYWERRYNYVNFVMTAPRVTNYSEEDTPIKD